MSDRWAAGCPGRLIDWCMDLSFFCCGGERDGERERCTLSKECNWICIYIYIHRHMKREKEISLEREMLLLK